MRVVAAPPKVEAGRTSGGEPPPGVGVGGVPSTLMTRGRECSKWIENSPRASTLPLPSLSAVGDPPPPPAIAGPIAKLLH